MAMFCSILELLGCYEIAYPRYILVPWISNGFDARHAQRPWAGSCWGELASKNGVYPRMAQATRNQSIFTATFHENYVLDTMEGSSILCLAVSGLPFVLRR